MNIPTLGFLNAAGTAAYVYAIANLLSYAERWFGQTEDTIFAPIIMLLLLILSASITGALVLGRPLIWFLEGRKQEAVSLFIVTLAFLLVFVVVALATALLLR